MPDTGNFHRLLQSISMAPALFTYPFQHTLLRVHLLDQVQRAGFEQVEIYCARPHFDYANPSHVREIAEWFEDSPVRLHSLHAPVYRGTSGDSPHSVLSIAFVEK